MLAQSTTFGKKLAVNRKKPVWVYFEDADRKKVLRKAKKSRQSVSDYLRRLALEDIEKED